MCMWTYISSACQYEVSMHNDGFRGKRNIRPVGSIDPADHRVTGEGRRWHLGVSAAVTGCYDWRWHWPRATNGRGISLRFVT